MRFLTGSIFAFLAMLVVSSAVAQSPQTDLTSREGILLLRNGQTLEGNITRTGDYYLVTRGTSSEVRLPAASVELVCATLEDLYQHKAASIELGNRPDHLTLARWCFQHDLTARAADQALMAFSVDPSDKGLEIIERQLVAVERQSDAATPLASNPQSAPTLHKINEVISALPTGAVQHFVTSIQPLLMNRCATNGCHGVRGSSDFQLLRPSSRQTLSRRMTQRNLFNTLAYVDRGNPLRSQLLTLPKTSHGGREAVFSEAETHQMRMLVAWVAGIANKPIVNLPTSVAKPPAPLLQTRAEAMKAMENARPTQDAQPADTSLTPGSRMKRESEYQPRDPFDPEVFNRRYQHNSVETK
jgi:hypothetical protein